MHAEASNNSGLGPGASLSTLSGLAKQGIAKSGYFAVSPIITVNIHAMPSLYVALYKR